MHCPRCSSEIGLSTRFCPACGLSLEETLASSGDPSKEHAHTPVGASSASWLSSSSSLDGGFAPGTLLLGRYRIVGLLGKGGMGEVYRADDLTLGQAVALKFLPRELVSSPERLARFHGEVRIARQVSHPNVCRVYDIGDLDGQPFLSMELVDGEDLASLLQRIGRLSGDKVVEMARQICAGLAAAHNAGVLHRDLKPANVMLDRRGKVRLTDFGLAVLQEHAGRAERSGTPAYMAPEQLRGHELSLQTDIYALGLVLFEMLTGKRPHRAESLYDLGLQRTGVPANPSALMENIDPALERVIMRCLEPEPAQRPRSAAAVAASLPGGDPLAAALDAGETPSPDMVAAAGEVGRLRPLVAWSLLGAVVILLAGWILLSPRYYLVNYVPLPKRPQVLEDRAVDMLRILGYTQKPGDHAAGFAYQDSYLNWVTRHDTSLRRWQALRGEPAAILFWYRQSPDHMRPRNFGDVRVDYEDPPPHQRGMVRLMMEPSGNLVQFQAVPPEIDSLGAEASDVTLEQEQVVFDLAGLSPARFHPVAPVWVPPDYCESRRAWEGTLPSRSDISLRLEAGWHAGKLVHFEQIGPWREVLGSHAAKSPTRRALGIVSTVLVMSLLIASVLLARSHLRRGRGDRRGATRLSLFIIILQMTCWIFVANHSSSLPEEFDQLIEALAITVFVAGFFWVIYVALEPYMRGTWPDLIISWARLLAGRIRDPLVGRDILIGVLFGFAAILLHSLEHFLPGWLGIAPHYPEQMTTLLTILGPTQMAIAATYVLADSMFAPLATVLLLLGMRKALHNRWLGAAVVILAIGFLVGGQIDPSGAHPQISFPMGMAIIAMWVLLVLRFGLLALVTMAFVSTLLDNTPITADLSRWYAGSGVVSIVVVLALAIFAQRSTLGPGKRRA
ncbi:MAG TPA: protein kinase [Candidatus Krumholzibacteria bacterium]|nr:protein kinase [Candidatus Krumholzibacteria bacterium]